VTANGLQSEGEIQWLNRATGARIDLRKVDIGYRQSRRLRDLSDAMANLLDGASHAQTTAPPGAEEADVWPLLAESQSGDALGAWLAKRIHEVEKGVGRLPSIAVFVDGDELIDPLVQSTERLLAERNIPIVGCKEGRIVGDAREVRVFDIQHIKGLEFEAVFFVGIDRLADRLPRSFPEIPLCRRHPRCDLSRCDVRSEVAPQDRGSPAVLWTRERLGWPLVAAPRPQRSIRRFT
jgi:hypothetical protein